MRLVVATVQDYDAPALLRDLVAHGWGATQVATTGKALRAGQATLLIGVPRSQVRHVLRVIDEHCHTAVEAVPTDLTSEEGLLHTPIVVEAESGGAIVSVLKVVRFERL